MTQKVMVNDNAFSVCLAEKKERKEEVIGFVISVAVVQLLLPLATGLQCVSLAFPSFLHVLCFVLKYIIASHSVSGSNAEKFTYTMWFFGCHQFIFVILK